ncbi:MAG: hypothetical protein EBY56_09385, partial [Actinobacteria bacterium]|nr:hypothetical protein [Actinomycetota bacterium]
MMMVRTQRHGLLARRKAKSAVSLLTSLVFGAIGLVLTPPEPVEATTTWDCTVTSNDGAWETGAAYISRVRNSEIEIWRLYRTGGDWNSWTFNVLAGAVQTYPISSNLTANALMMDASGQMFIHIGPPGGGTWQRYRLNTDGTKTLMATSTLSNELNVGAQNSAGVFFGSRNGNLGTSFSTTSPSPFGAQSVNNNSSYTIKDWTQVPAGISGPLASYVGWFVGLSNSGYYVLTSTSGSRAYVSVSISGGSGADFGSAFTIGSRVAFADNTNGNLYITNDSGTLTLAKQGTVPADTDIDGASCTDVIDKVATAVDQLTYDANSGTGAPAVQDCVSGSWTVSSTAPTRSGYTFTGWNTVAGGTGTAYAAGDTITCNGDETLYAQWDDGTFDPITTSGDGWDVTFHPTNQNYVFFAHHKSNYMGCVYRLDPDGAGPIQQGDGCFDSGQLLSLGSNVAVGLKSSMWVTSDGNTAYIPLNHESYAPNTIVRVNISDADPNNWSVIGTVNWAANMQHHSNSIMVDDALWASASSGLLKYDTTTQQASTYSKSMWEYAPVVHADGKIWSVASDWSLVCLDIATGAFCSHGSFVDGVGASLGSGSAPSVVMEYRNTDGSFGGFCSKDGGSNEVCVNTDGASSSTMVNPASNFNSGWGSWSANGLIEVSDQHQMIQYQPLASTQNYTCWDYTTQAACAGFTPSSTSVPSSAYTVRQDPWIPTCFWTNAHDNKIG